MLFVSLLATSILAALSARAPMEIGQCDPVAGPRGRWTAEQRREVRRRVRRACREGLRASPIVCAYYDAVVVRESSGNPGARHTLGKGENGLGAMGLSLRWHADKWPGRDEDPAWCTPEASLVVAHAVVWRAFTRYHARTMLDVQAVYAGRWTCHGEGRARECWPEPTPRTGRAICGRLQARGFSCDAPITRKDLGRRIPYGKRRAWVAAQVAPQGA